MFPFSFFVSVWDLYSVTLQNTYQDQLTLIFLWVHDWVEEIYTHVLKLVLPSLYFIYILKGEDDFSDLEYRMLVMTYQ